MSSPVNLFYGDNESDSDNESASGNKDFAYIYKLGKDEVTRNKIFCIIIPCFHFLGACSNYNKMYYHWYNNDLTML